jgi:serine-type D-Ala-D-Ala carboxypeptidase/endopeptidase (penicillin-binding protein 4)
MPATTPSHRNPYRNPLATFLAMLVVGVLTAYGHASIVAEIDRAIRSAPLQGATVAVSIRDAETNAAIVSVNASRPMIPASNMKLLTAGAALHVLGPDFSFNTKLKRDGDRLIIIGDGDPAFGDPNLLELMTVNGQRGIDLEQFIAIWTNAVRAAGITTVSELIIDDRIFDRDYLHPGWPVDQLNRRYCAEVAGLNFHLNVLHFFPRPTDGQRPDISRFEPYASWLQVNNSATNRRGKDDSNTAWIARQIGTNNLRMYGNVKFEYRVPVPVTVHDMPNFFARYFTDRLRAAGVQVRSYRLATLEERLHEGDLIAPVISTPIATVIERCNRDSQNMYAEALLKRIGAETTSQPGSWQNGGAVLRHVVQERLRSSALLSSIVVSDGSGLSRGNRVSPETLTAWLNTFHHDQRLGPIFIESLAQPGDQGTLRRRFGSVDLSGAMLHAKSGYINEVSCLSGYVTTSDGRRRSFSIMINEIPNRTALSHARALQERIVKVIADDLAREEIMLGSD